MASTTQNTTATPANTVTSITSGSTGGWFVLYNPLLTSNWVIDDITSVVYDFTVGSTVTSVELDYFPVTIPNAGAVRSEVIEDVTVRISGTTDVTPYAESVGCKLRIGGVAIGTSQSNSTGCTTENSTGWEISFTGWDTLPTEEQLKSTQLGAVITLEGLSTAITADIAIDGVSITAQYSNTYEVEERIYTRLSEYTALTDITSTSRIYLGDRPQGADLPAASVERISGVPAHAMSADPNYVESRFQVNCYAAEPIEAMQVARQVHNAMSRWDSSTDNVEILSTFEENRWNGEEDLAGADRGAHWVGIEYQIVHRTS